ncbi:MAG: thymidylate synthase [Candidatus Aenigmarchaeota archaeon]|nr:thymidylate synthase [Candidatus Aenigmarchaeota archaeon]
MKKDILVINPRSNIAISTLWSKKEFLLEKIPENVKRKIGIIGTTYTSYGINYILETLAENPQIDTLILYGYDLSTSGEVLCKVFGEKKMDLPVIILDKGKVEEIVRSIKLVDLRKAAKEMKIEKLFEEIEKNYCETKPKRDKIDLKVEEKSSIESYPFPLSGHYIYDNKSVFRAWVKILDLIMRFGSLKFSEYEIPQKEFLNVVVSLGLYGKDYKLEKEFFEFIEKENFERHINEVLSPKKPEGVEYTYGERFFAHRFGKNQINYLIDKLSKSPYSRRALVVSWDHEKDQNIENPPCIIGVQGIITENFYNHTVIIRSNDMFKAWPVNFVAQIELAKFIVNEINKRANTDYKLGSVTSISISAHIYQTDFERAKKVIEKYSGKMKEFVEDPKGNFLIYLENGKVVLEHRTPDNSIVLWKNSFENFEQAYEFLKSGNMFSFASHAFYLSKELKNAFEKLKKGEEYEQDSA